MGFPAQPGTNDLISQGLSLLACKVGIMIILTSYLIRLFQGLNAVMHKKPNPVHNQGLINLIIATIPFEICVKRLHKNKGPMTSQELGISESTPLVK